MQGRGGGRDPFSDFGGAFGGFGGFGHSFGPPESLFSSFFGGRDPFNDPFFTRPFGGMFESSPFGGPTGFPFPPGIPPSVFLEHQSLGMHPSRFLEDQSLGMHPSRFLEDQTLSMHPSGFLQRQALVPSGQRGPIIQELDSDDENEDATEEKNGNPRKHSRSNDDPFVEHPDDEIEGKKKSKHLQTGNEYNRVNTTRPQPQSHSFCFQSSTVSCGGPNGMYYTSSRTRRSGSDGVTFEERKEADSSTRQASHVISRGIHGQGYSHSRKLNSNGKVDTMQTLHNINEAFLIVLGCDFVDELAGFKEEWKAKGQKHLPGWTESIGVRNNGQGEQARQGGWALPSSEPSHLGGTIFEARDTIGSCSSPTQERVRTDSTGRKAYRPRGGRDRN
ncbi:hypothetical protein CR513_58254, partial [Mucuna pruriens]